MNQAYPTVFTVFSGKCRELVSDSKGAALAITLAFVMPIYLLVIGIYGIGEVVRSKIELQNAADAAAYSASVVQADYLSRIATVNKAMAWTYVDLQKRSLDLAMDLFCKYVFIQFQKDLDMARRALQLRNGCTGQLHGTDDFRNRCGNTGTGKKIQRTETS